MAIEVSKATYKAAQDAAEMNYRVDKAKCASLIGNDKDVCIK